MTAAIYNYETADELRTATVEEYRRYFDMIGGVANEEGLVDGKHFGFPGLAVYMIDY